MSPRNAPEAVVSMLEKTFCHRIISQPSLATLVNDVTALCAAKGYKLQVDSLMSLDEMFPTLGSPSPLVPPYPPSSSRIDAKDDVVLIIHSSGSTGFPKPILETQHVFMHWVNNGARHSFSFQVSNCSVSAAEILDSMQIEGRKYFSGLLPSFHALGIVMQLFGGVLAANPIVLFTPRDPEPPVMPNPHNVLETCRVGGCDGLFVVPAFIEVGGQCINTSILMFQ